MRSNAMQLLLANKTKKPRSRQRRKRPFSDNIRERR